MEMLPQWLQADSSGNRGCVWSSVAKWGQDTPKAGVFLARVMPASPKEELVGLAEVDFHSISTMWHCLKPEFLYGRKPT